MNLFTDILCLQDGTGLDGVGALSIAYMSEIMGVIDGSNNSTMAAILTPEVVLFANPFTQFYCMGDAVLTTFEMTDVVGYWCVGGHTIFPLSNFQTQGVGYVDSASIVAAKMIFKMTRSGALPVCAGNQALCGCYPVPVWNKLQYRLQMAMPLPDILCRRMGKPFILWTAPNKNPPMIPGGDNLVWLVWRRRECCAL
jgi:conjugal transfer pilus assembly protein TraU